MHYDVLISAPELNERSYSVYELVSQHCQLPCIDPLIIPLQLDHFWSHEFYRSTEGVSPLHTRTNTSKVTELDLVLPITIYTYKLKHDILRFQITMHRSHFMKILDRLPNLLYKLSCDTLHYDSSTSLNFC